MNQKPNVPLKYLRTLVLVTFLVGVLCVSSNAQISVGMQVGANQNQFTMPGSIIGLNSGLYVSYAFVPSLSLRLEILYSQEGGGRQNYTVPLSDPRLADIAGNLKEVNYINPYVYLHNISVPLMLEVGLPGFTDSSVKPKVLLGGSYANMLFANELHTKQYVFKDGTFANIPYLREDVGSDYVATQISAIAGIGVVFESDKRNFSFDIRYRQGLTQLNNITQSLSFKDGRLFSSTLSFNFSMSIFKF